MSATGRSVNTPTIFGEALPRTAATISAARAGSIPRGDLEEKMNGLLFRYFPFLTWDRVIVTGRKQMIRCDVLIDDGVHNLEGGDYKKILFTAPHNRQYDAEANGMVRADTWEDVIRIIDIMTEGQ